MNLKIFETLGNKEEKIKIITENFNINEIEKQLIYKYDLITKPVVNTDMEFVLGVKHTSKDFTSESQCTIEESLQWLKDDTREALKQCKDNFKRFNLLPIPKQLRLIAFAFNLRDKFIEYKKIIEECR